MKSWVLILIIALSFLPSLIQQMKKKLETGMSSDAAESNLDKNESDDDNFFDFDEQPASVYEQREYQFDAASEAINSKAEVSNVVATAEETTPSPTFDLRQAVIYQILLENKYINMEK